MLTLPPFPNTLSISTLSLPSFLPFFTPPVRLPFRFLLVTTEIHLDSPASTERRSTLEETFLREEIESEDEA